MLTLPKNGHKKCIENTFWSLRQEGLFSLIFLSCYYSFMWCMYFFCVEGVCVGGGVVVEESFGGGRGAWVVVVVCVRWW